MSSCQQDLPTHDDSLSLISTDDKKWEDYTEAASANDEIIWPPRDDG